MFDELGLDAIFVAKAKLAIRISKVIREAGISQRRATACMGISQAKLSQLTCGHFEASSEGRLVGPTTAHFAFNAQHTHAAI
ncbi:XRE family transcriptional regulator [Sphingomonas sp. LaA6.9]|uniref:XRE family transcriptional regulator n=1 Tax=Sphingomonas sp. LaA6.9 TaxID=2919914 RepID=UPI00387E2AD9